VVESILRIGDGYEVLAIYIRAGHQDIICAGIGMKTANVCRRDGMSRATFYNWKAKDGGLDVSEARRLKALGDDVSGGRECSAEEASGR